MPEPHTLYRAVVSPHRNLSPWIGGALLSIGGLAAIAAIGLTPVRRTSNDADPAPEAAVTLVTPELATPWGIRVGDTIGTLRERHPDIQCTYDRTYGAAENDESFTCRRVFESQDAGSFVYEIDLRDASATAYHHVVDPEAPEYDYDLLASLTIKSIAWSPGSPR
jgi:hypothetical protein